MAGTIYQTNTPPIKGSSFTFYISLVSQADTDIFKKTVTLAAGDVRVSKDGGGLINITALPVEIAATGVLAVALTGTEMTANTVVVSFVDVADDEWQDALVEIRTVTDQQTNIITAIWANATRTLSSFGTLVADVATAVWAAGTRTLTSFGTLVADAAAAVWAYATRTLTASAASTIATVSGSDITIVRGDTLSVSLTGLGALTGYTSLWFTVKDALVDLDSNSIIQIKLNATGLNDGLLYFNKVAAVDELQGSIVIDDDAAGDITITLDETLTDDLKAPNSLIYDVQVLNGGNVTTLTLANCTVAADITKSIL